MDKTCVWVAQAACILVWCVCYILPGEIRLLKWCVPSTREGNGHWRSHRYKTLNYIPLPLPLYFWFKYDFGQKYHALKVWPGIGIRHCMDGSIFKLRRLKAKTKVKTNTINDFLFADDCALNSISEDDMQQHVDKFTEACTNFSLTISIKKTEVMHQPAPGKTYIELLQRHFERIPQVLQLNPDTWEVAAQNRDEWHAALHNGAIAHEKERTITVEKRRQERKLNADRCSSPATIHCPNYTRSFFAQIGLTSHLQDDLMVIIHSMDEQQISHLKLYT